MERENRYRGKRKDNNQWEYGYYFNDRDSNTHFIQGYGYYMSSDGLQRKYFNCEVLPETVGQYLEKNDKNKKEIFEDDILKNEDLVYVVRFDIERCAYVLDEYGIPGCMMEYGWDEDAGEMCVVDTLQFNDFEDTSGFLVVGNIVDNPELIKIL